MQGRGQRGSNWLSSELLSKTAKSSCDGSSASRRTCRAGARFGSCMRQEPIRVREMTAIERSCVLLTILSFVVALWRRHVQNSKHYLQSINNVAITFNQGNSTHWLIYWRWGLRMMLRQSVLQILFRVYPDYARSWPVAVRMTLFVALFAMSAVFGSAAQAQDTSTRFGMGGKTGQFGQVRQQIGASGQEFRIEGHCQSACTMFLKLKNACVEPSAELLFHAGSNAKATQQMMNSYNGSLRAYLVANHYMETTTFHTISGQDIIHKFGYRACKPK